MFHNFYKLLTDQIETKFSQHAYYHGLLEVLKKEQTSGKNNKNLKIQLEKPFS